MTSEPDAPEAKSTVAEAHPAPNQPRVVMPDDPDFAPSADHLPVQGFAAEPFHLVRSVAWALVLAVAAAMGWALITVVTGYQLGLIAVVVGILAGVGAAKGGRSKSAQVVGASAAAFAYFLGQAMAAIALFIQQAPAADDPSPKGDPAAQIESASGPSGTPHAHASEAKPEKGAPPEPVGLGTLLVALFAAIARDTFSSLGVLFLGIAVWEGWRIPRPRQ